MRKRDNHQEFTRRAVVFGAVKGLAFSGLIGRLLYLQFLKSDEYKNLAEGNSIKLVLVPPYRGALLDRNGEPLAVNQKNYRIMFETDAKPNVQQTIDALKAILPVSEERAKAVIEEAGKGRFVPPILVKDHLSWEELSKVEFNSPHLPGIFIDVGQVRYYPLSEKAAHLIGHIATVSEAEIKAAEAQGMVQPLLKHPDFRIGKHGAERTFEDELRGAAGLKQVEVNVRGVSVRELSDKPSIPGKDIRLTIDARLQAFTAERLGEESASVVVMDIQNGDILSLVSMPAFDPNIFSVGIPTDYWKSLHDNKKLPLVNKSVSGQYPPGSTFKVMVGLAGLAAGVVTPTSQVHCPGHFFLGNHQFNCWKPEGHGSMNVVGALAESCDTYFYTLAQKLGIERIVEMSRKFGLGSASGLGLPGEMSGLMPDPEWKRARHNQPWQTGDTVNAGIGQGYVLTTPLQLAVMTARLASGGLNIIPRLALPEPESEAPVFEPMGIDEAALAQIIKGMEEVTNSPRGTAYGRRILDPHFAMAGKTGTSQVRKITVRGRNPLLDAWEHRHHALFVGYAPIDTPRYAIAVVVEHGGGGSSAAAPIARDVLEKIQQLRAETTTEPAGDAG